jgi:L-ascorbate metabolism protein UlaG (beta-lactamase superfamily)
MPNGDPRLMLVGGPTLLIEWHGLRLLTDPTFDPGGRAYPIGPITLNKEKGPALAVDDVGPIDAVLLSHDEHPDNLDTAGRALLTRAGQVLTTTSGAARLGGGAIGLAPWATTRLPTPDGGHLVVTGTPARHGPPGCEPICGEVTGFVLEREGEPGGGVLYISGDTVWYEGVAEVARRFRATMAVLFLGAARLPAIGLDPLTMTASEAVEAARAFGGAVIVPAHHDGWAHWTEGRAEVSTAFAAADLGDRLRWLEPGVWSRVP